MKKKWKYLFVAGGFIGVFLIGLILGPYSQSSGKVINGTNGTNQLPSIDIADESKLAQEKWDDTICPITGASVGYGTGMGQYFAGTLQEVIADRLGMNVEELLVARRKGNSIADLAELKDVNMDELMAAMIEARKVELEQLLKEGVITEEQMEAIMDNIESRIETAIQRETVGPFTGRGGKMGRSRGGGWNNDMNLPQNRTFSNCPCGGLCWMY
jgi:hypothetical protein